MTLHVLLVKVFSLTLYLTRWLNDLRRKVRALVNRTRLTNPVECDTDATQSADLVRLSQLATAAGSLVGKVIIGLAGTQAIANSLAITAIDFDNVDVDTKLEWDTDTNLFTPSATGYYMVSCRALWAPSDNMTDVSLLIVKGTSTVLYENKISSALAADGDFCQGVSGLVYLTTSDTLKIAVRHDSAGSRSIGGGVTNTYATIFRVL